MDPSILASLPSQLQKFGNATSFIVYATSANGEKQPAALANCIFGFSTFNARPLMNIHDMFVHKDFRGRGYSQKLLQHGTSLSNDMRYIKID